MTDPFVQFDDGDIQRQAPLPNIPKLTGEGFTVKLVIYHDGIPIAWRPMSLLHWTEPLDVPETKTRKKDDT